MNTAFLTSGRRIERLRLSPEKLKITGFQSPAGDHEQGPLSIDEYVGLGAPHIWLWIADSDALVHAKRSPLASPWAHLSSKSVTNYVNRV